MWTSNHRPTVSIGMPVHNGDQFLRRALDSLLAQDYDDFELIISDNASTDGTREICKEYLLEDERVRYRLNERNVGAVANFRQVLLWASGKYFMWAAHDDWWEPGFVSHLVDILESDSEIALAASEVRYCLPGDMDLPFFPEGAFWRSDHSSTGVLWKRLLAVLAHNYGNLVYGLYRRDALMDPGDRTVLDVYEGEHTFNEIPIFLQVAAKGKIYVSSETLFHKRQNMSAFIQAASEYGLDLKREVLQRLTHSELTPSNSLAGRAALRPAMSLLHKTGGFLTSAKRDLMYHNEAFASILRAIRVLNSPIHVRVVLRLVAAWTLYMHLLRLNLRRLRGRLI